ncbi:MAG: S8/S53 family peptidase [bacterium]
MKKILIIDTQGEEITPIYRSMLPGIALRGVETDATRGTPCHEHGALCGWLAAIPCIGAGLDVEIVFARMFDKDARPIADAHKFILNTIAAERPDYISRSWGAWDFDSPLGRRFADEMFAELLPRFIELQQEIGFLDFGAAGNNDENDADQDVDAPQSQLPATVIVGACGRNGVPTEWSGDGVGVACVMWADRVYSPDMAGRWILWSGTSAATPKLCGACAALGYTSLDQALKTLQMSERPDGEWTLPHPKWGLGCAESLWQNQMRRVPAGLLPPYHQLTVQGIERIEFFDFRRILEEERVDLVKEKRPRRAAKEKKS